MSDLNDQQLLGAWARHRDQSAFRALLGRYAGLVHGAALRRVGDAGLAQEISQEVFARLSQNAGQLLEHPTLAGWLHRAAMLLALDRLRGRARHARKLEKLAQMPLTPDEPDPWAAALPHLDAALDCLSAPEREVLMLHFAERRTFPQIAAHLHSTPDAIRMRTNRALAALSKMLGKKGVLLPMAVIASGLGGTLAQAAPASLLALSPAALAGMGKVSALSMALHAMETTRTAKVLAGAALAMMVSVPLGFQQSQIAAVQARIATLALSSPAMRVQSQPRVPTAGAAPGVDSSPMFDLRQLAEDALDFDYPAARRFRKVVGAMDANNLCGLLQTALQSALMPKPRDELLVKVLEELRQRDPALFLEWSMKVFAATVPTPVVSTDRVFSLRDEAEKGFRAWMAAQPAQAAAWAEKNNDQWKAFGGASIRNLLVAGLLQADPPRAYAMLERASASECMNILSHTRGTLDSRQSTALAQWAASSVADADKRRRLVRKALWFTKDAHAQNKFLETIRPALTGLALNADDLGWVAARLALDSLPNIESNLAKTPGPEIAWLEKLLPASHAVYARGALGHFYQPTQALIYLNAELDKSPDDNLIAGYVESRDMSWHRDMMLTPSGGRHGDTAFRLATRVQDPERRAALLALAWSDLQKDSASAARDILFIPELSDADRAGLQAQIAVLPAKKP